MLIGLVSNPFSGGYRNKAMGGGGGGGYIGGAAYFRGVGTYLVKSLTGGGGEYSITELA